MKDFGAFNLHPGVAAGVTAAGYSIPTPIQVQAIPKVLEGRDVLGTAQTGTGKTAAFVLPILDRLMKGRRGVVRALIVAPTRELAEQIHEAIRVMGRGTGVRSMTIYGGVNINPQIKQLRRGVDIVVACPGRLLDHVGRGTVNLSGVEVLVLDEADHMFDMGFLPDVRRIIARVPKERQTLMFSATMPREISRLAEEALTRPVTLRVDPEAPASTVSHALYPVAAHLKIPMLVKLLRLTDTESVLIFTRTKHRARQLADKLVKAGYRAACLQGNLSQSQRKAALDGFRDGRFQILAATDIAARGIDVTQISHVINFDIPDTPDAYIHRIGRTGRAARTGDAFTLATGSDHGMVRSIEKLLGCAIERRYLADFDYRADAPASAAQPSRPPRPDDRNRRGFVAAEAKKTGPGWARRKPTPTLAGSRYAKGRARPTTGRAR